MGLNVLYLMLIVFLLFQTLDNTRQWLKLLAPDLGVPLPDRDYATACDLTHSNGTIHWPNIISVIKDEFFVAHFIGWFLKSLFLRDELICWVLSIGFELWEFTFEHMLPNFAECWWDHLIVDVLVTNWLGIYLGMKLSRWLQQKEYDWAGIKENTPERVAMQILPNKYMPYHWEIFSSWKRLAQVGYLILIQSLIELNYFWLKFFLWIPPPHNIIVPRLFMWGLIGSAAIREYYDFITSSTKKFGTMAWLGTITVSAETLLVVKYGHEVDWEKPTPAYVIWAWGLSFPFILVGGFIWYGRIRPRSLDNK